MISEYQKFILPDKGGKYSLVAEVNWSLEDSDVNESKIIKFTLPNREEIFVERKHLNEILFALGNPEDQRKLIPQNMESVHWRTFQFGMRAHKDIRKGEMINPKPVTLSVPCTMVREIMGEDAWKKEVDRQNTKALWKTQVDGIIHP